MNITNKNVLYIFDDILIYKKTKKIKIINYLLKPLNAKILN